MLGLQWKHVRFGDEPYIQVEQQFVSKKQGYEPPKANSRSPIAIDHGSALALQEWKEHRRKK